MSPSFFGYETAITEALTAGGVDATFLDERPSNASVARVLFRAAPRLARPWVSFHFRRALARLRGADLDLVLIIKGESTPRDFVEGLRRDHPRATVAYYAYDSMAESGGLARIRDLVDVPISFDREDVAKDASLHYLPLFYTDDFFPSPSDATHDVAFVGTVNPQRYAMAQAISHHFPSSLVHLYSPAWWYVPLRKLRSPEFRGIDVRQVSTRKMPRAEVAEVFRRSRVVVDQQKVGQGGLTMRTFEALASGAGLVTSNARILEEPFSSSPRIAVVPHDDPTRTVEAVRAMLASSSSSRDSLSISAHSVHAWVADILALTEAARSPGSDRPIVGGGR